MGGTVLKDMKIISVFRAEDDMVQEERQTSKSIE